MIAPNAVVQHRRISVPRIDALRSAVAVFSAECCNLRIGPKTNADRHKPMLKRQL